VLLKEVKLVAEWVVQKHLARILHYKMRHAEQ
jgi:hypothetical protein